MLNPGTYLQNRYEILEKIGSGGMSVVYKARCHTLDRLVAIKVLKEEFAFDESFVSKFKMEAQSAARLSHPNIVSVYDVVDEDVYHYIVMELIEGITLKNYIEKKGYLESKEAIGIALQVGQGMAAAHEQHIIHRDIKPQNMIISRDGKVKVADFGIARAVSSQTMNATAVGSVHYISPEQARGGYCDERSDIYSFGITMYEMATGRVPFEGDNTVTVALAHLEEPVTPPSQYVPDMSHAMEQIILRCTQKRPDRRYASVIDVIADLRKALMDPDCDIYEIPGGEEMDQTRTITREEMVSIQGGRKSLPDEEPDLSEEGYQETDNRLKGGEKHRKIGRLPSKKMEDDVSSHFERIITVFGIVAAIIIVAVVLFVFSRLTGLFRQGTGAPTSEAVTVTTQAPTTVVDINTEDQIYMPNVLGLPKDMAREKLKESTLVMEITGSDYSDNYETGQVMGQDILEGTMVKKWSTVKVTISKGSDKINLGTMNLTQMTEEAASKLLEDKGLSVEVTKENSDTVIAGNVIRFSPQTAKVGESVNLYVSKGSQNVEGRVPNLLGQPSTSADALLAGAGLLTGNVTIAENDTVEEGLVMEQSQPAGTVLAPGTAVDYVVSGSVPAETQAEAADDKYYVGSIDTACSLSNYIGPASQTSSVRVLIRLKQVINGEALYTNLMAPRLVVGAQTVPVSFARIKGAYGIDSGTVEVVDADRVDAGNEAVIASYPVTFFPIG